MTEIKFSSVFFGGGTPSVFSHEYEVFLDSIRPNLQEGAEISIEANPEDVSSSNLETWRNAGINRLSLGIQSFNDNGLKFLTREHRGAQAVKKVELSKRYFDLVNIDLIYGWPEQTQEHWQDDLDMATKLEVGHLSLYNLIYEPNTVIGRRKHRGLIHENSDAYDLNFYEFARQKLKNDGFLHEEVSNWALAGHSCKHNWLYWSCESYIAVGPGAHGFLAQEGCDGIGVRYHMPRQFPWHSRADRIEDMKLSENIMDFIASLGGRVETDRDRSTWVLELISSSIRTSKGLSLKEIEKILGRPFKPRPTVKIGIEQGLVKVDSSGQLKLTETEWFRETYWALELALSYDNK
jgi:oxygen-independent coproporphyrinogen-3 oxidase